MIGESLMKNTLRLMTIFMGIIGGCAAILVVFILAVEAVKNLVSMGK